MSSLRPILITGGAGFIGSHLAERLLADGHRVVVVDDFSTGSPENLAAVAKNPGLQVIESRVSTCRELSDLVGGCATVYHLAAAVGVDLVVRSPIHTIANNLDETSVVLEAAGHHGVPVILTSTSEVYGKSQNPEFSEEDDLLIGPPHLARWAYACSKLMDEFLALAYRRERHLAVTIVRLFNTVGPRQTGSYGMVLPRFIAAARAGQPLRIFGDGAQTRCFCYVGDTVEALVRLRQCSAAVGEVLNVGSTEEIAIRDLALLVKETLASPSLLEYVPYDVAYAPGFEDMRRRKPSVEKLARLTGFRPCTPLRDIIRRTAASPVA
jgi:UDP-glucose 4-epimerase